MQFTAIGALFVYYSFLSFVSVVAAKDDNGKEILCLDV